MNFLIDYLSFTLTEYSLYQFLKDIHFFEYKAEGGGGGRFYKKSLHYSGIHIYFNGETYFDKINEEGFFVDMTGIGCRTLETIFDNKLDWLEFITKYMRIENDNLNTAKMNITRLDIACDDKPQDNEKPLLNFYLLRSHYEQHKFIAKAKKHLEMRGTKKEEFERAIYFGSPESDRRIRIYDKQLEREQCGKKYGNHWVRVEMQCRRDAALHFYIRWLEKGNIGDVFSGVLLNCLRFTNEVNKNDHNQGKLTVCKWWSDFCNNAEKIKGVKIGGLEYNLDTLEDYIRKQVASSLLTYVTVHGGDINCLNEVINSTSLNLRQAAFLESYFADKSEG